MSEPLTVNQVKQGYENQNGKEAAEEVPTICYVAATEYANLNEYDSAEDNAVLVALDVFRLIESNQFEDFFAS